MQYLSEILNIYKQKYLERFYFHLKDINNYDHV